MSTLMVGWTQYVPVTEELAPAVLWMNVSGDDHTRYVVHIAVVTLAFAVQASVVIVHDVFT